jgi:hypothetical protein
MDHLHQAGDMIHLGWLTPTDPAYVNPTQLPATIVHEANAWKWNLPGSTGDHGLK